MLKTYYKITSFGPTCYDNSGDWFDSLNGKDPRDWLFETREEAEEIFESHYRGEDEFGEEPDISIEKCFVSSDDIDRDPKTLTLYASYDFNGSGARSPIYEKEHPQDTHKEQFSTFGYYFG